VFLFSKLQGNEWWQQRPAYNSLGRGWRAWD